MKFVVQLQLLAWHGGRTLVFRWRTFHVLHSTCSGWVTTYVRPLMCKLSTISHPTRPTQPFVLSGSINGSKLQLDVRYVDWGGAVWWMLTGWRSCVAGWSGSVFASCLVRCTASVAFADQLPLPRLYSTPGRGFVMEVALYQVSTLSRNSNTTQRHYFFAPVTMTMIQWPWYTNLA